MMKNAGAMVKRYREQRGINQSELAKELRTDKTVISRIENGLRPSRKMAVKLAKLMECGVEVFL